MNTKQYIQQLKEEYASFKPPVTAQKSWLEVETKLLSPLSTFRSMRRQWLYVLVSFVLLISSGVVIAAQWSEPGETLYSLRQVAAPIITALGGNIGTNTTPQPAPIRDDISSKETLYPVPTPTIVQNDELKEASDSAEKKEDKPDSTPENEAEKEKKGEADQMIQEVGEKNDTEDEDIDKKNLKNGKSNARNKKWYDWLQNYQNRIDRDE